MKKRKSKIKLDTEEKISLGIGCGVIIVALLSWLGSIALNVIGGIVTTYMWNLFAVPHWGVPEISVWLGIAIWLIVYGILRCIFKRG